MLKTSIGTSFLIPRSLMSSDVDLSVDMIVRVSAMRESGLFIRTS